MKIEQFVNLIEIKNNVKSGVLSIIKGNMLGYARVMFDGLYFWYGKEESRLDEF